IDTRRELGKYMIVRVGGFEYEAVFGISEEIGEPAHASVYVHFKKTDFVDIKDPNDISGPKDFYCFEVDIEFHPLKTSDVREAQAFGRSTKNALKKLLWAKGLVHGLVWDWKTIKSLEVE
ncbi:MAG: hypothetical protein ACYS7Y_26310, partial [Planctomycetota bacterium]